MPIPDSMTRPYMERMATTDTYSRLITALKVVLPLTALGILATLFLVAERLDPEAAIPYADVSVDTLLREQGVTRPSFGGVAPGGAAISVTADSVRPDLQDSSVFDGKTLRADIDLPSGTKIGVESPTGRIDGTAEEATLYGGVTVTSSLGWTVVTETITASMPDATIATLGEVNANGPAGIVTAGRMILRDANGYHLVFEDGVTLIYQPEQ